MLPPEGDRPLAKSAGNLLAEMWYQRAPVAVRPLSSPIRLVPHPLIQIVLGIGYEIRLSWITERVDMPLQVLLPLLFIRLFPRGLSSGPPLPTPLLLPPPLAPVGRRMKKLLQRRLDRKSTRLNSSH